MRKKQLLGLVVVALALVAVGVAIRFVKGRTYHQGTVEGGEVLADFPVDDVARIEITGPDGEVLTIHYADEAWRVAQRYDYPANTETLRTFILDLSEMRAAQALSVGESQYGRLDLKEPGGGEAENCGTKVAFYGTDGSVLETLVFGKQHERQSESPMPGGMGGGSWPDGRYLRVAGENQVILVSKTFSNVEADPTRWLDKEFFKVGDVQSASLSKGGETLWQLSREDKSGSLVLEGEIPDGREPDTSAISSIQNAFSWASFTDVADPERPASETGMDDPHVYVARTFDGFIYTVRVGTETDDSKYYVSVSVAYDGPDEREASADETPEDKERKDEEFKKTQEENREKAEEMNARLDGWVYVVNKYSVDSVLKTRDDLLKDLPEEESEGGDAGGDEGADAQTTDEGEAQADAGGEGEGADAE